MKYLKSYRKQSNLCNESIRHLLKPKNDEELIKSLKSKGYVKRDIFIYFIENGIPIDNIINKMNSYFSARSIYHILFVHGKSLPFTDEEKDKLDYEFIETFKSIYYEYDFINKDNKKFVSLYIKEDDMDMYYEIKKLDKYITVSAHNNNRILESFVICPNIDHLIDYLKSHAII